MARGSEKASSGVQLWMVLTALAVVSAVLVAAYFLLTRREMAVVFKDLRPTEAAAIVAELEADAIPYELREGGTTILVSTEQVDAVRLRIAGADLPVKGLDGFELFDASDLGLTDFAQRIKYQRAMQGELARTIMKIEGVTEARVHLSIPERSVFRGERMQAKAAVTLLTRAPEVETPATIAGVQELVAAAITDLAPGDVIVLNGHGEVISQAHGPSTLSPTVRGDIPAVTAAVVAALPQAAPVVSIDMKPAAGTSGALPAQVHIATGSPLSEAEKAAALASVRALDPAVLPPGLPVSFDAPASAVLHPSQSVPLPAAAAATPNSPPSKNINPETPAPPSPGLDMLVAAILLVVLAGVIAFLVVRRTRPVLSIEDQRRFADKLKLGLKSQVEDVGDAA